MLDLEARTHSQEESIETLQERNAALEGEIAALRLAQAEFVQQQEAAQPAREREEEVTDLEEDQDERLTALEEGQGHTLSWMGELDVRVSALKGGQALTVESLDASESLLIELEDAASELNTAFREDQSAVGEQLDDLDTRMEELEEVTAQMGWSVPSKEDWAKQTDNSSLDGTVLDHTRRLPKRQAARSTTSIPANRWIAPSW